ncbi:hypothetical protein BASA83_007125 [Batrachochytrium salamandrivorans]|nr:hypothetical protein BASA83_007125 [Batrachochytrium salamandrivorans]
MSLLGRLFKKKVAAAFERQKVHSGIEPDRHEWIVGEGEGEGGNTGYNAVDNTNVQQNSSKAAAATSVLSGAVESSKRHHPLAVVAPVHHYSGSIDQRDAADNNRSSEESLIRRLSLSSLYSEVTMDGIPVLPTTARSRRSPATLNIAFTKHNSSAPHSPPSLESPLRTSFSTASDNGWIPDTIKEQAYDSSQLSEPILSSSVALASAKAQSDTSSVRGTNSDYCVDFARYYQEQESVIDVPVTTLVPSVVALAESVPMHDSIDTNPINYAIAAKQQHPSNNKHETGSTIMNDHNIDTAPDQQQCLASDVGRNIATDPITLADTADAITHTTKLSFDLQPHDRCGIPPVDCELHPIDPATIESQDNPHGFIKFLRRHRSFKALARSRSPSPDADMSESDAANLRFKDKKSFISNRTKGLIHTSSLRIPGRFTTKLPPFFQPPSASHPKPASLATDIDISPNEPPTKLSKSIGHLKRSNGINRASSLKLFKMPPISSTTTVNSKSTNPLSQMESSQISFPTVRPRMSLESLTSSPPSIQPLALPVNNWQLFETLQRANKTAFSGGLDLERTCSMQSQGKLLALPIPLHDKLADLGEPKVQPNHRGLRLNRPGMLDMASMSLPNLSPSVVAANPLFTMSPYDDGCSAKAELPQILSLHIVSQQEPSPDSLRSFDSIAAFDTMPPAQSIGHVDTLRDATSPPVVHDTPNLKSKCTDLPYASPQAVPAGHMLHRYLAEYSQSNVSLEPHLHQTVYIPQAALFHLAAPNRYSQNSDTASMSYLPNHSDPVLPSSNEDVTAEYVASTSATAALQHRGGALLQPPCLTPVHKGRTLQQQLSQSTEAMLPALTSKYM